MSEDANAYLLTLQALIDFVGENDVAQFKLDCDTLRADALQSLTSENEKVFVGSGISIAKYSAQYWSDNFDNWKTYFGELECNPANQSKLSPKEKTILQADARGAIRGGIAGAVGGGPAAPLSAFLGALLGGGMSSCIMGVSVGFGISHITSWFF